MTLGISLWSGYTSGLLTAFKRWRMGAATEGRELYREMTCQVDATMRIEEGSMEKKSCSNWMLKSNCRELKRSRSPSP